MCQSCGMPVAVSGEPIFQRDEQKRTPANDVERNEDGGVEITVKIHVEPSTPMRLKKTPHLL